MSDYFRLFKNYIISYVEPKKYKLLTINNKFTLKIRESSDSLKVKRQVLSSKIRIT